MKPCTVCLHLITAIACQVALPVAAQQPLGWVSQIDGLVVYQSSADLDQGGDFSATRSFLRATGLYNFDSETSLGFSLSYGQIDYDFSAAGNQPWNDIRDIRISVPLRFQAGQRTSVFISPQVRWDYQSGAELSDGRTYGVFAGIAWSVSESLTIGPALGAFTQLEDSGVEVFPALLVDWDINDRWNLNTGSGIGATRGPGLTLSYAMNGDFSLSLSARSEKIRFRLDDSGLAPNGIGEDQSIPVVASLNYTPNPGLSVTVFAGAEFDGRLTLEDETSTEISRQSYDTAPLVGLAFRLRF
ncbi:hypothetical protein ABLN87_05695 [Ruegeria sp. SCPT10]|uniref:hypothetical protein n=1 Tax=Ruegeria sp. SCP10 TaxID=3141377 RepID=UPI0033375AA4